MFIEFKILNFCYFYAKSRKSLTNSLWATVCLSNAKYGIPGSSVNPGCANKLIYHWFSMIESGNSFHYFQQGIGNDIL